MTLDTQSVSQSMQSVQVKLSPVAQALVLTRIRVFALKVALIFSIKG